MKKRLNNRFFASVLIALLFGALSVAGGVPKAHATEDATVSQKALNLAKAGLRLARKGAYREAVKRFEAAFKLHPRAIYAHNLARAHQELRHYAEAYAYFVAAKRLNPDYDYARDGARRLDRLRKVLLKTHAHLSVVGVPEDVAVVIRSLASQKTILLTTPAERWVRAGKYTLTGRKVGYRPRSIEITVGTGQTKQVELVLPPLPKKGFLTVTTDRTNAVIYVNEKRLGPAPIRSKPFETGVHTVSLRIGNKSLYEKSVTIKPNVTTTVNASLGLLKKGFFSSKRKVLGVSLYGAGAVLLATGIALHASALGVKNEIAQVPSYDLSLLDPDGKKFADYSAMARDNDALAASREKSLRGYEAGAWVSYLLAIGCLSAGTYFTFYADRPRTKKRLGVTDGPKLQWRPQVSFDGSGAKIGAQLRF